METEDETVASRLSSMELDENKSWPKIQEEEKQPLSSTSNTFWLSSTKVRLQWIYTSPAESIDINKVRRELDQIIINRQQNARRDWWQKAWGLTDPSPKLDLIWRDEKQMKFKKKFGENVSHKTGLGACNFALIVGAVILKKYNFKMMNIH